MIRTPGVCVGVDRGDGHCEYCTLPMVHHPVEFVWPWSDKAPDIARRAYERRQEERSV